MVEIDGPKTSNGFQLEDYGEAKIVIIFKISKISRIFSGRAFTPPKSSEKSGLSPPFAEISY
jgi:hypothetical protein